MPTLVLSTQNNPGTATWTDASTLVGGALINTASETQPLAALETPLPLAGVTVPANTLQDGYALNISCAFEVNTAAALNPNNVTLGFKIQGTNTQSGIFAPFTAAPGGAYLGGYVNLYAVFTGGTLVLGGQVFLYDVVGATYVAQIVSTVNSPLSIDYTQPCAIVPVCTSAVDNDITFTASALTVQIVRP